MDIKVYEVEINDETEGISLVIMVKKPAIESNFIKLSEQEKVFLSSDESKQYVTGAVLIPEKQIYRRDNEKGEYFIKFSSSTIEKIRNKFMSLGNTKVSNLNHESDKVFDAYLIESWIVTDAEKDKAVALGFQDVQVGTLYATYHIPDKNNWLEVAENMNGFSLEGSFNLTPIQLSEEVKEENELDELINLIEKTFK